VECSPDPFAPNPPRARGRGVRRLLLEGVRSAVLTLALFVGVRTFLVEAFKIPTSSMEGTLLAGDFLLVNKAVYGAEIPRLGVNLPALSEPQRGEVIVFNPPHEPQKHYVKRLVGLPGDTLEMRSKRLWLNGRLVEEPYVLHSDSGGDAIHPAMAWQARHLRDGPVPGRYRPSRDNWGPLVVPEEQFFVLGDNRDNSEDSRYWGFVDRSSIRGKPWLVYYSSVPADRADMGSLSGEIRWDRILGLIR